MFNAFQAIQAGELGRQHKEQRERKNAFATAGDAFGAGDYSGASQALLPHDLSAGMQMAQYGQQQNQMQQAQAKQSERQQAEGALALTDNMLQIPEAQRGEWLMQNWQSFSPYFDNKDFMSFWQESGGDVSDATLQQEMATLRTQLGQGAPEQNNATFGTAMHEVIGPDGAPMFVRTDNQGGIHAVDDYTPKPDAKTDMDRVQSTFTDPNGNLMMVMRDGTVRESGHGVQNPFQITDVGGVPTAINRRTGEGIAISTPEEVGSNAATINTVKDNEEFRAQAQRDLPQTIENATRSLEAIDGLLKSPGFDSRYGMTSVVPAIPGTEMANTQAFIDQIGGQAFLEAFESLKGGGQITEIEGQKATAAITRLGTQGIQPEAAREAAKELQGIIIRGIERARAEASGSYAPQGAEAPPLVYNPETGEFD